MSSRNGPRPRSIEERIVGDALREHWDPIGCGDMPYLPDNEYDRYALRIVRMLQMALGDKALAAHLASLEEREMGLRPRSVDDLTIIASAIRKSAADAFDRAT